MSTTETLSARNDAAVIQVATEEIVASSLNPRKNFPQSELAELADSIREQGIIQPIVVRPLDAAGANGKRTAIIPIRFDKERGATVPRGEYRYEIVAGERRWRAAQLAGLATVPVIVREGLSDETALKLAILENVQRTDLDPIEEAEAYRRLKGLGSSQTEIAASVQKQQSTVSNSLRLLDLPADVQAPIRDGKLSRAHGVAICALKDHPQVASRVAEAAIRSGWTTAATEEAVRELAKIRKWPELMECCLETDGKALAKKIDREGYYIPGTVSERVKLTLERQALLEEKARVEEELRKAGKTLLKTRPDWNDKKLVELRSYNEDGRVHKKAGLTCEAYFVEASSGVLTYHYCTDPEALKKAVAAAGKDRPREEWEIRQEEEKRIRTARAKARDAAIDRWARGFQMPTVDDLMMFASKRVDSLLKYEDTPLLYVASRLGIPGKSKSEKIAAVKEQLREALPRDVLRVWILAELSTAGNSYDPVPSWMKGWLDTQGYADPAAPPAPARPEPAPDAGPPPPAPPQTPSRCSCGQPAAYAVHWTKGDDAGTILACHDHSESAQAQAKRIGDQVTVEILAPAPGAAAAPSPNGRCHAQVARAYHWEKDGRIGTHFACAAHHERALQDLQATGAEVESDAIPAGAAAGLACGYGD